MTNTENEKLHAIRHSAAHIMADAVMKLYPGVKLGIGPAIDEGFYYDFDFSSCSEDGNTQLLTPEDLPKIEKEMRRIIKRTLPFEKEVISRDDALKLLEENNEPYKVELLKELPEGEEVSIYKHGDFFDLCKGPHVANTGKIGAFKLLSLAGAYWRGSEENTMLQRIYGAAFESQEELDGFITLREEAQKRDHRKLGKEMELFSFNDKVGAGLVIYHPKGALLRQLIVDYITEKHLEKGYQLISSPHIMKSDIWQQSGHYGFYKENMYFFESEEQEYAVKPMNCPGHIMVYASRVRSYRELPLRLFELGTVYRHEKSGVLHGLLRVRGFTQDDAHLFCRPEQVEDEIEKVIDFVDETLKDFGFLDIEVELSTRPEKFIGSEEAWEEATSALKNTLDKKGMTYDINEGDGAFYGPKIDIKLKDALGRSWQCATVQCDFSLPERFDLKYIDHSGDEKRPVVLHRVVLGSLERFIGALIEHYGGNFPLWLAPTQAMMVPITGDQVEYAEEVASELRREGFRVEVDPRDEKMQKKIRDAEVAKIPYMIIVGKREAAEGAVSLRSHAEGNVGAITRRDLLERFAKEVKEKK